jgi:hypothetical protein
MLEKIKYYWSEFRLAIIAAAIAIAYFLGKKRGKNDEKTHQNNKVLANLGRANKARRRLDDTAVVDKLHDKYRR